MSQSANRRPSRPTDELSSSTDVERFPNGFACWQETHFEVVEAITTEMAKETPAGVCAERAASQGRGGLWELAQELTDKFERQNQRREWDGEFYEEIESFLSKELGANQ